jgi:hypothetical protein
MSWGGCLLFEGEDGWKGQERKDAVSRRSGLA